MTILVTRPSPAGELLVSRLQALGKAAYHAPLIDFAPGQGLAQLSTQFMALREDDLVFILSKSAVSYADAHLRQHDASWPKHLNYYAIGRSSGLAFHTVSQLSVSYPPDETTSEALLALPALQQLSGRKALLLRGNGGRELLATTLRDRGVEVIYCECYQRHEIYYAGDEQSAHWQRSGISTLIVTSGEMLQQLYHLVPDDCRHSWLLRCRLVVVSPRLAELAGQLGWHNVVTAESADNDALLHAV